MRDDLELLKEIAGRVHEPPIVVEQAARRALLAAAAREQRRARMRRLRRPVALAIALLTVVAALLVGVLARGDSPSVAAKALAAVNVKRGIMHFVAHQEVGALGSFPTGVYSEYWIDLANGRRARVVGSENGHVIYQYAMAGSQWEPTFTPSSPAWQHLTIGPRFDPMSAYRLMLRYGTVESVSDTTFDGHEAIELKVIYKPPYDLVGDVWTGDKQTYVVDRQTLFPLELTYQHDYSSWGNGPPAVTRYPVFEILPETPQNKALVNPVKNPQAYHP